MSLQTNANVMFPSHLFVLVCMCMCVGCAFHVIQRLEMGSLDSRSSRTWVTVVTVKFSSSVLEAAGVALLYKECTMHALNVVYSRIFFAAWERLGHMNTFMYIK